jgi:hypothetical protein
MRHALQAFIEVYIISQDKSLVPATVSTQCWRVCRQSPLQVTNRRAKLWRYVSPMLLFIKAYPKKSRIIHSQVFLAHTVTRMPSWPLQSWGPLMRQCRWSVPRSYVHSLGKYVVPFQMSSACATRCWFAPSWLSKGMYWAMIARISESM